MALLLAATKTRPVFWHFVPWLKVLWYVLAVLSVLVFLYGVYRPIRRYRRGHGGPWPPCPWRELPGRLASGARLLFSHRTIGRRDHVAGLAHRGIFYGFLVLFAGTVILGFETDFTDPVFGWTYFHGNFYLIYKEVLNVFGTLLILGVLVMMIRRTRHPAKLSYDRPDRAPDDQQYDRRVYEIGDWVFVIALLVIAHHRLRARGRADRDVEPGLRRHPVRRLDRGPGADRGERADAGRAAPRPVVVPRAAGDRVRGQHPLHQGHSHADQFRQPVAAGSATPESGCARSRPSARRSPPGTARWPTSARCTCSSSTPVPSAAAATRRVRPTPPGARCPRVT